MCERVCVSECVRADVSERVCVRKCLRQQLAMFAQNDDTDVFHHPSIWAPKFADFFKMPFLHEGEIFAVKREDPEMVVHCSLMGGH